MFLINRYEGCIGITFWRWKQFRMEIWFCPPSYEIKEHCHPSQHIELKHLWGEAVFYRRHLITGQMDSSHVGIKKNRFKQFTVAPHHSHWFVVFRDGWLVFLNKQTFLEGKRPKSAAEDFKLT